MREWLNILDEAWVGNDDHAHRTGEDEYFRYGFGVYWINVDEAKRRIASGEFEVHSHPYAVKDLVERIYKVNPADFGAADFEDDSGWMKSWEDNMLGPPVSRKRMKNIPADKMDEPVLFMMWNSAEASRMAFGKKAETAPPGEGAQIIDGNHRLMKRYYEGDTSMVTAQFIKWEDIKKVATAGGKPMA